MAAATTTRMPSSRLCVPNFNPNPHPHPNPNPNPNLHPNLSPDPNQQALAAACRDACAQLAALQPAPKAALAGVR
eukprot:scaffold16703_cov40-Phaeocystis_antarctica.AAC.1